MDLWTVLKKERGHLLLEVLMAFLLLAIITGPLLNLFHGGRQNYVSARKHTTAAYLAREKMEGVMSAGYDFAGEEYEGAVEGFEAFSRRVVVTMPEEGVPVKQITVEVTWSVNERQCSCELISFLAGR
jgi:Tfp pilus assembly protein PilV